jgi:hypothetical protein
VGVGAGAAGAAMDLDLGVQAPLATAGLNLIQTLSLSLLLELCAGGENASRELLTRRAPDGPDETGREWNKSEETRQPSLRSMKERTWRHKFSRLEMLTPILRFHKRSALARVVTLFQLWKNQPPERDMIQPSAPLPSDGRRRWPSLNNDSSPLNTLPCRVHLPCRLQPFPQRCWQQLYMMALPAHPLRNLDFARGG